MAKFRTQYNYDIDAASSECSITFDPSKARTDQSFKAECDINTIVKNFGVTGQAPVGVLPPSYADFEGIYDFHSAMNTIAAARESFDSLPADVRQRFNHDPGQFVDFCSDHQNLAELEKLGLVIRTDPTLNAPQGVSKDAPIPTPSPSTSNAS